MFEFCNCEPGYECVTCETHAARMTLDTTPRGETTIGCCVCLNVTGKHIPAASIINGYAVCEDHIAALSSEFSDFAQLINRIRTQGDAT